MKKIILSFVALLSMTVAMAQSTDNSSDKKGDKRPDPKEMVEKRTQEMVEKYALSTEQAEKLKALNEKYMSKMGPRGKRPGNMKDGERPEPPKDMQNGGNQEPPKDMQNGGNQEPPKDMKNGKGGPRGPRPDMTEYNNELKTILSDAQYKAYEADQAKRMEEMKARHQKKNEESK